MNKTLNNILYVFLSVVLAKLVSLVPCLVLPKMLQPANYGIWVTLILLVAYTPIACLGTIEALVKQVPYFLGREEYSHAKEVEGATLSSIVLSAVFLIVIGQTFLWIYEPEGFKNTGILVNVMLVTAALSFFSAFYFYRFNAHQKFKVTSCIDVTRSVISCILLTVGTWKWGLPGTVAGFFLCELIICIMSAVLSYNICGRVALYFKWKMIAELIKVGLPISLVWWIYILQVSADRLITMLMLGKTMTGYYGLGTSLISIFILIPHAVGQVLYPKINERIGQGFGPQDVNLYVISPTRALSLILTFVIGIAVLLTPLIFYRYFPDYGPGVASTQILILGAFFTCLNRNGVNFLIARDMQNVLIVCVAACLAINIAGNIMLIKAGYGIEGVALGTGTASFLMTTLTWRYVLKCAGFTLYEQAKEILILYAPFIVLLIILAILKVVTPVEIVIPDNITTVCHTVIFALTFIVTVTMIPPMKTITREIYRLLEARW